MSERIPESDPDRSLLGPLFAFATRQASIAMGRWTGGRVRLSMDECQEVSLDEAASQLGIGGELSAMVVLGIDGDHDGQFVLLFDDQDGRRLAAGLLGREADPGGDWTAVEESAAMETGNILASAYLNALTRLVGSQLMPSPPSFVRDYGVSVLQQALMMQALASDRVLVCRTRFECDRKHVHWNVFFLPGDALRIAMQRAVEGQRVVDVAASVEAEAGT